MFKNFNRVYTKFRSPKFGSPKLGSLKLNKTNLLSKNFTKRSYGGGNFGGGGYGTGAGSSVFSNPNLLKAIGSGIVLIGGTAFIMKTMNQPTQIVNNDGRSAAEIEQERLFGQADLANEGIPTHVKEYLHGTYKYVALNIGLSSLAAVSFYKSGVAMKIATMNPIVSGLGMFGGMIGTSMLARSVDQDNNPLIKYTSWVAFNAVMGASLCTLGFMYRPELMLRAGVYTAGVFGALSFTAMNAENGKFLNLGGPLLAGLTVLCLSSITGLFLPARFTKTLSLIENFSLYGGLAIFGGLILYDTQRIMARGEAYSQYKRAEMARGTPAHLQKTPDYIANSISPFLNIVNLFVRILFIMGRNKNNR